MKNDPAQDLPRLIAYIEAFQEKYDLTFAAMLRRFPRLGTDRTFGKLKNGEHTDLNIAKWAEVYAAVVDSMEAYGANAADEVLFDDLSGAIAARREIPKLLTTTGNDRFFMLTGENGYGKTSILTLLGRKYGDKMVTMQAVAGLTGSEFAFAGELLMAIQGNRTPDAVKKLPRNLALRLAELHDHLKRRIIICIEEAHDLDPEAYKLIKHLINATKVSFLLAGIEGIWIKLTRSVFDDVSQLTGNRSGGVIRLGLPDSDIDKLIRRICRVTWDKDKDKDTMRRACNSLRENAARHGGLKFISKALRRATEEAGEAAEPVMLDHIYAGIAAEKQLRGLRD